MHKTLKMLDVIYERALASYLNYSYLVYHSLSFLLFFRL
jgi:hypothetical protein